MQNSKKLWSITLVVLVILAENTWLWAQNSLLTQVVMQAPSPRLSLVENFIHTQKTSFDVASISSDQQLHVDFSELYLENNKAHLKGLRFRFSSPKASFKNSFFKLECEKLEAALSFENIEIALPEKIYFSLNSKNLETSLEIDSNSTLQILDNILKSFDTHVVNNAHLYHSYSFKGDCPGRSEKILKNILWEYLVKEIKNPELTKAFRLKTFEKLSQSHAVKDSTLQKVMGALNATRVEFEAFFHPQTRSLQVQGKDLVFDDKLSAYLNRSQQVALKENKTWIYADMNSVQTWLNKIYELPGFLKSGFELGQSENGVKEISYLIKLGWSVDKLRLFNPLFRGLPKGRCFDIEIVTRDIQGNSTLPFLKPFKSQGGFKTGFDFTSPSWMVFRDSETKQIFGEQYLGQMYVTLEIVKNAQNAEKNIRVTKAFIQPSDEVPETPKVPGEWVDTINWSLDQTSRGDKVNFIVLESQKKSQGVIPDILEKLSFAVIPSEESRRELAKDSFYARGLVFKF